MFSNIKAEQYVRLFYFLDDFLRRFFNDAYQLKHTLSATNCCKYKALTAPANMVC